jgi:hypothetical protein
MSKNNKCLANLTKRRMKRPKLIKLEMKKWISQQIPMTSQRPLEYTCKTCTQIIGKLEEINF